MPFCNKQPTYKLTYFNIRGRGEVARMMLSMAKVKYTEDRIEMPDWMKFKAGTPFGSLPTLAINDTVICQTEAINEYIARQFGYAGKNTLEDAQISMIANCINDTVTPTFSIIFMSQEEKEKHIERYRTEQLPVSLSKLEKLLASNNGGNGFFVGNKLSYADLKMFFIWDMNRAIKLDFDMTKYPKLDSLHKRLQEIPQIKEYIANRPFTEI